MIKTLNIRERLPYIIPEDPLERKLAFSSRLGLIMMIISIIIIVINRNNPSNMTIILVILIIVGFFMSLISTIIYYVYRLKGKFAIDERMKKLRYKAAYYAFILAFSSMMIFYFFNELQIISLTYEQRFYSLFLPLFISLPIFYWYFNKKGDTE